MKFIQARVNGGSNYDSQPVREAIVGGAALGALNCVSGCLSSMPASRSGQCLFLLDEQPSSITLPRFSIIVGGQRQHNLERGTPPIEKGNPVGSRCAARRTQTLVELGKVWVLSQRERVLKVRAGPCDGKACVSKVVPTRRCWSGSAC